MKFHKEEKQSSKKFELDKQTRERIELEFDDTDTEYDDYDFYDEKPPKKRKWLRKLIIRLIILCIVVILINLGILLSMGKLWFNEPKKRDYPVRGPVVNESLGKVGWENFAGQNIQMAYIRATKSTAYEDENFAENKKGASETELSVGALHIFDIGMDGKDQAEHFIETVGDMDGWIVPAVEVKLTGFYRIIPVDYDRVSEELLDYTNAVYEEYGVKPVIKCNKKTYEKIAVRDEFSDCPIWYESFYSKPEENVRWNFWGYSNKVKFSYYESGDFLEMTLFSGSEEDFSKMIIKK